MEQAQVTNQSSILDFYLSIAEKETGVPRETLEVVIRAESGFDTLAKNPGSSAAGLFQFTESTWDYMVRKYGARHSLTRYNADIYNPLHNILMGAEFTSENSRGLRKILKREPTLQEIYLAHFSGLSGASRVLNLINEGFGSSPSNLGWSEIAIQSNPSIFLNGDGSVKSIQEAYSTIVSKVVTQNENG